MTENNNQHEQKKRRLFLRILKVTGVVAIVLILALALAIGYLYTNQDSIKKVITQNLNQNLNTEISVGSIDIDFFQKFPEVSVRFSHVRADEALEKSQQSLFLFKHIYVRFSILDLINQDYTIRKLSFDEGEVNLRVTQQGKVNYHFWKDNASSDTTSTNIDLENVEWTKSRFRYIDQKQKLRVLIWIDHLETVGAFAKKEFEATIKGKALLEDLTYKEYDLADSVKLSTKGILRTGNKGTLIDVTELLLGEINLSGKGEIVDGHQLWQVKSNKSDIVHIIPLIPQIWRPNLSQIDFAGRATSNITINLDEAGSDVRVSTTLEGGRLVDKKFDLFFSNVTGIGVYHYSSKNGTPKSSLNFSDLNAKTRTGSATLNLNIQNLVSPSISASATFSVGLDEVLQVSRPQLIEKATGRVKGSLSYKSAFKDWQSFKSRAFEAPLVSGKIEVASASMRFQNSNIDLKNLSADLTLKNKDIEIERLYLKEGNSEFMIDGWMRNIVYMGPNRPIPEMNIRMQSQYVDLDRIMEWKMPKRTAEEKVVSSTTGDAFAMNFNVLLDVKKFNLIRFNGINLSGEIWNDGLKIKGKDIALNGLDGKVKGNFAWSPLPQGNRFWTSGTLTKINIHKLFNGFKNFGQDWLLADNIYGIGTAGLETSMAFDQEMNFIPASFKLVTSISIDNGRLTRYKPLMSLSSIVDETALEDVHFDHLENEIAIANEIINIPKMEIKSSALDLLLLGRHSFDQQIDYSIRLALKDALGKKKKNKKTDLDEWIVEVETTDQPYIWVHVGCSIAEPCLSLDREMLKKGVKEEWKKQGEDIKNIFKPDTAKTPQEDPTKGEVIFEWNEEEPDTNKR